MNFDSTAKPWQQSRLSQEILTRQQAQLQTDLQKLLSVPRISEFLEASLAAARDLVASVSPAELNLDLRATVGVAGGRYLVQSNTSILALAGGLIGSLEQYTGAEKSNWSIEGLFVFQWDWFKFIFPKLDSSVSLSVFPSLTDLGRVRFEFNSRISFEIFKDFYLDTNIRDSFDSRPPEAGASKNDFSLDASVRWTF